MEWLGIVMWAVVLMVASPLGLVALTAPSFGLVPPLAIGGLATCVLYLVIDDATWLAWLSAGLALGGAGAVTVGAAIIVSSPSEGAGQTLEENAALVAGSVIPLLLTTAFVMVLAAVGVTTVG